MKPVLGLIIVSAIAAVVYLIVQDVYDSGRIHGLFESWKTKP